VNGTSDTSQTAAADNGGDLNLQDAAALVEQTKRRARRQFDANTPLVYVIAAVVVLGVYGMIWLSVRGQHPYKGPTAWDALVVYPLLAVMITVFALVAKRAYAGVIGRSQRQRRAEAIALVVVWVAVYVFQGALYAAGVSHAIAYGLYPAVGPLIIAGAAMAGIATAREDWLRLGIMLAVVAVGAIGAFGGPVGVWAVAGLGLFAVLLGAAVATAWRNRA
jgi:hypothetical protein